jgi:hypothetical protein
MDMYGKDLQTALLVAINGTYVAVFGRLREKLRFIKF